MIFDGSPTVIQPFLRQRRSTSTPKASTSKDPDPLLYEAPPSSSVPNEPKIIFERRSNVVDINHALVELNADRNLFVLMPHIELEGTYGEIRWANWRQTGLGVSGDIDVEEDDVNEEIAMICKTLKPNIDRPYFGWYRHAYTCS